MRNEFTEPNVAEVARLWTDHPISGEIGYGRRIAADRLIASPRIRCRGFTMIEAVVSAGLLLVVMTFVLQMTHRVDAVWGDTGKHRVAIHELSNQLERLTLLAPSELAKELDSLEVSSEVAVTLLDPELSGEIVDDAFGKRLVLRLNWLRRHPGQPIEMSGWLRVAFVPGAASDDRESEAE